MLPRPGSLSTASRPPICSTSRMQMVSPRPVPPYRRVVEASAWENGSNSRTTSCGAMPMPVSQTSKRNAATSGEPASTTRTRTATSPVSVNFSALPARLMSTWRSRPGSVATVRGTDCSQ